MKKQYKLSLKNYILITLYIISIMLLCGECKDLKTLILTKIISLVYFVLFTRANFINNTK